MLETEPKTPLCFLDTNIWLYAFIEGQDSEKSMMAKKIIQNQTITTSTQVINEVCVNLLKKAKFSEEKLRLLIQSFYDKYGIIELNQRVFLKASELREAYQFSFWDSLVVSSALQDNVQILYSEDMHDGLVVEKQLKIINPFKKQ